MGFTGGVDGSNTFCNSGQDVFLNALPNCHSNQQVTFDGSKFICEDKATTPVCAADQVLTYTSGGFVCVAKGISVPTCAANQFLTYNGTSFQCASTQSLTIPTCGPNQMLTGSNGQLTCADLPGTTDDIPIGGWCGMAIYNPDSMGDASYYYGIANEVGMSSPWTTVAPCKGNHAVGIAGCPDNYVSMNLVNHSGAIMGTCVRYK